VFGKVTIGAPKIVGIVNLSADSFYDGGRYVQVDAAVAHARSLAEAGADVIELGAVASNVDASEVAAVEEIRRLEPVLDALEDDEIAISVDSFSPATQSYCIDRGVSYINDINGFPHPQLYEKLAAADCGLVVMHSLHGRGRATRELSQAPTVLERIFAFFDERIAVLERAGVAPERIVIDPGMGLFLGANAAPSVHVLRHLGRLRQRFGKKVLVSVSRKSFLGSITGRDVDGRGPATLAAELYAVEQGVDYVRTHDVAALADALAVRRVLDAGG